MEIYESMHSVHANRTSEGHWRLYHLRLDPATRRMVTVDLGVPEKLSGDPWTWEELILAGIAELLERRLHERSQLL